MSSELQELYQQVILDHNRQPRNFRVIENGTSPVHVALQSDCYRFVVRN